MQKDEFKIGWGKLSIGGRELSKNSLIAMGMFFAFVLLLILLV